MEEIQFLNYIMSIGALLLAAGAFWMVFKSEEKQAREIKDLKERINAVAASATEKRR
jgi:hypothetical protein